ncbi:amino acid ABC transporter substrate-binding protein, PAAT family [Mariprofundus aestuarium]|uniref:Amino acid ABC transporter substrate-binding protein, PAAT family n=1 Tax=Mariprofundus aestuarium TaxID=1921086 RepID=A0A2K8L3H2_MARES|nr:ABC transporter substrate-binding protein [Mariprofundus aestuarium]ATX79504.1 amino acid ABC transporter substrate-binding protein, PAAT family [Mariprofundus aestuarium]
MVMFYRVMTGILLLLTTGVSVALADDTGLSVSLDANESPPYWSQTMVKDGMCGEILHAASEAAGLVSHVQYKPLTRMIEDDTNNDLGNPEFYMGNQDFAAVIPVCVYHVGLFYYQPNHKNKLAFTSIEDLKGYKVGILKGTLVDQSYFERAGVKFEESYSQASLFKKLQKGRIDLVIEIDLVGMKIINRLFPDSHNDFVESIIPGSDMPIAILISSGYPDAKRIGSLYRKGMKKIKASGLYVQILESYYGAGQVPDELMSDLERHEAVYNYDEQE